MPIVNRDSLFAASRPRVSQIHLKTIEDDVFIRRLSGAQRAHLGDEVRKKASPDSSESQIREFACPLIALSIVNEQGECLFSDADLDAIGEMNYDVIQELTTEILRLNGLVSDSVSEAKNDSAPVLTADSVSG